MRSRCTNPTSRILRRRRGTAEIELLVCAMVMISMLFLIKSSLTIALARVNTTTTAGTLAFNDAILAPDPRFADDQEMQPIDGVGVVRAGLPNRMHVPRIVDPIYNVATTPPVHMMDLKTTAAVLGPPWLFSAYPVPADQQATRQWFLDYVDESHSELISPLLLAPAWNP